MANKIKIIKLSESEINELEKGAKSGGTYSKRCHMILLKSRGYTSLEIGKSFQCTCHVVDRWVNRYLELGIQGLRTKTGQGRPKILFSETDKTTIENKIENERQRLKHIKEDLENELNKNFSIYTLVRFLKKTAINGEG
jgi:transposase